jgi:bifunctional DNA-binding transcriptional regulator/antitoxin component of YhaV-PrlF toxin-antitoxin module
MKRKALIASIDNRVAIPSDLLERLNLRKGDLVVITIQKVYANTETLKGLQDLLPITL